MIFGTRGYRDTSSAGESVYYHKVKADEDRSAKKQSHLINNFTWAIAKIFRRELINKLVARNFK
jgi:hypothetical protein